MTTPTMPTPLEWLSLFAVLYNDTNDDPVVMERLRPFHERMVELQHRISQTDPAKVSAPRESLAEQLRDHAKLVERLHPDFPFPFTRSDWPAERDKIVEMLGRAAKRVVE